MLTEAFEQAATNKAAMATMPGFMALPTIRCFGLCGPLCIFARFHLLLTGWAVVFADWCASAGQVLTAFTMYVQ